MGARGAMGAIGRVTNTSASNRSTRFDASCHVPLAPGSTFTSGSKLDGVQKRWRRLVVQQPRERRCTFRCATDSACEAVAAFFPLTLSRRSQSPPVNVEPSAQTPRMRVCRAEGDSTHAASRNRKARERVSRVDFRQRVRVVANQLGCFEPRDRCGLELASSRRVCVRTSTRERFPGVRSWRPSARHTRIRGGSITCLLRYCFEGASRRRRRE